MRARHSLVTGARGLVLSLSLVALALGASASEVADFAAAKAKAVATGKNILIDFSSPT